MSKKDHKYKVLKDGADLSGSSFVIREQDLFGPQALWGYVHVLNTALELDTLRPCFTPAERENLTDMADAVSLLAQKWQQSPKKIPD